MQIIAALRNAGHRVTFSMPLNNFIGKKNAARVLPMLSREEVWACENFFDPDVVINRIQPDIAITCNVNTFRTVAHFAKDVVHIVDLNGPLQFEGLLLESDDYESATHDSALIESRCRDMVEQLRHADYVMTVSDRQKYFWSAYCSLAGFSFSDLNVLLCPAAFEVSAVARKTSPNLTVVYSGGFYPWQHPDRFLKQAANILEGIAGASLHIYGAPHTGFPNETAADELINELQQFTCVKYHGYRPIEELLDTFSVAWCALELMEQNIERELAITGRTVVFLSTGTPVIYNDYSTLSQLIKSYNAGWALSTNSEADLQSVFEELLRGGPDLVNQLSANALRLATSEFQPEQCMAPLVALCDSAVSKRKVKRAAPTVLRSQGNAAKIQNILAISPDTGALRELRILNPLRSLRRQGYISNFGITDTWFNGLKHDKVLYDSVIVQRKVPEFVYQVLRNLSVRFIQDIDDNVLARASYREHEELEAGLVVGLQNCAAVSAPNPRLIRMLEKYSGLALAAKAFITPNALPFSIEFPSKAVARPTQIIWIQSDIAALGRSREAIVGAVEDFSQRYDLPILLVGRNVLNRPQFKNQIVLGEIDFASNLQMLQFMPTSIGVAPLETVGDQETLDFVAGKSDLKMLLFGGYGHPAVYSAATPYTDSGLQKHLGLVSNGRAEWSDALENQLNSGWRNAGESAASIQFDRHIDRVGRESWLPLFEACSSSKPVRGSDLYAAYQATTIHNSDPTSMISYVLGNQDVLDFSLKDINFTPRKHYKTHGLAEQRHGLHSAKAQERLLDRLSSESTQLLKANRERIREMHDEISRLQKNSLEAESLKYTLLALRKETDRCQDLLSGILTSRSWRLTAPLRRLTEKLRSR